MKVLVFDTETTGLPFPRNPSIMETNKWPYIVQLSYLFFDISQNQLIRIADNIIKIPEEVAISQESIAIHGITRERVRAEGINIQEALRDFNVYLRNADMIVGHNIAFDKRMIMVESIRNNIHHNFTINNRRKVEYCTMKNSVELCKIPFENPKRARSDYKYPKLSELYYHLFKVQANNLHNSMADVLICFRAYCRIAHNVDVLECCPAIRKSFEDFGVL
jgi:DNA polymerase III subunit epsilon